MKKAYFIDLDNTIYFTKDNAAVLLGGLYGLLEKEELGITPTQFLLAKQEMLKSPFLNVAKKYGFSPEIMDRALLFLNQEEVLVPLKPHDEYHYIKALQGLKFIVTAGFEKKQKTKLKMLGIAQDFDELFVVDVGKTTKKDAFIAILDKYKLDPKHVLVVGDDVESEIRYGLELGMETFLYDPEYKFAGAKTSYHATTFKGIGNI